LLGVPVVHTGHTQTTNWRARWFGFFGQHVTAVCNSTKEYLVRRFGIPPERITVIHATSRLVPPPQLADIESVRGQFGLHPRQPVIVCVARLSPEKGHAVLLRAMLTVRREFPDARLLLVGKGHIQQQLEELTASLGLSDCVTFAGYRKQPGAIVAAASVAVLPSLHSEGFPLINIECLRLGIPVVSSNTDGVPELIRDGETGLLVPPGNAAALADAICRLLRDPAFATRLAQTGRAVALARFDPTLMCQQYEAYFASVLGQPPRPEVAARLEQLTANSA
jgi:glycosyltransferase involved in cell wall biosynthesis